MTASYGSSPPCIKGLKNTRAGCVQDSCVYTQILCVQCIHRISERNPMYVHNIRKRATNYRALLREMTCKDKAPCIKYTRAGFVQDSCVYTRILCVYIGFLCRMYTQRAGFVEKALVTCGILCVCNVSFPQILLSMYTPYTKIPYIHTILKALVTCGILHTHNVQAIYHMQHVPFPQILLSMYTPYIKIPYIHTIFVCIHMNLGSLSIHTQIFDLQKKKKTFALNTSLSSLCVCAHCMCLYVCVYVVNHSKRHCFTLCEATHAHTYHFRQAKETQNFPPHTHKKLQVSFAYQKSKRDLLFSATHIFCHTHTHLSFFAISAYVCVLCAGVYVCECNASHNILQQMPAQSAIYPLPKENMRGLRSVGSFKLQVSLAEYGLFYRALLQKRPIHLRSLLIVATPYLVHPVRRNHLRYVSIHVCVVRGCVCVRVVCMGVCMT